MAAVLRLDFPAKGSEVRAPWSKGCLTCRRRKVKCDERHPTCERCERGRHPCLGYEKPLIFVNHSSSSASRSSRRGHSSDQDDLGSRSTRDLGSGSSNVSPSRVPSDVGFTGASLNLNGFQNDIVIAHFLSNFTIGFGGQASRGADAPTMAAVLASRDGDSGTFQSGLGVARAFFGHLHHDDEMVRHSVTLYGKALTSLRAELRITDRRVAQPRAYMNLWTSLFLGMYEIVSSGKPANWLQHSMGVAALTQSAGPEAFQSAAANAMFESYRSFIAAGHLVSRKRCFLSEPRWKTIPWASPQVRRRTLSSLFCDVLCDISGLMEDVDTLLESEKLRRGVFEDRLLVQNKILRSIGQLSELRWRWEATYPYACTETLSTAQSYSSVDECGPPLFATCYEYADLERAADMLNYNAIRLMLYTLSDNVCLTDDVLFSSPEYTLRKGPPCNPLVLPGQSDRLAHAWEICRTAEYMLRRDKSRAMLILLFPLRVAYTHVLAFPHVVTWIQRLLSSSGSRGLKLGEHVLNMTSESTAAKNAHWGT